jgi:hypothetical protein
MVLWTGGNETAVGLVGIFGMGGRGEGTEAQVVHELAVVGGVIGVLIHIVVGQGRGCWCG